MRILGRILPVVLLVAASSLALYPLCGALFRCGCVSYWAGAAEQCNIHAAHGPHCPWCESAVLGGAAFVLILGGTIVALVLARRRGIGVAPATVLSLASLPVLAFVAAGLTFLATDYPHFLIKDARARVGLPNGPMTTRASEGR